MDMSAALADSVWYWAGWVLVGALVFGVLATYAIVVSGNVRDTALKRELAAAAERTAELEREAVGLRLELDREIQKRAPRRLTEEQKATLIAELRGKIHEINVVVQKDIESKAFALQLEIAFSEAGIKMHPYDLPAGDALAAPAGIVMYRPGSNADEKALENDPLYIALKKAGLYGGNTARPFSTLDLSPHTPELPLDIYTVYIGQKLPW